MANTIEVVDQASSVEFTTEPTSLTIVSEVPNLTVDTSACPITTTALLNTVNVVQSDIVLTVNLNTPTVSVDNTTTVVGITSTTTTVVNEGVQGPQGIPGVGSDQDQTIVSAGAQVIVSCVDPNVAWSVNWQLVLESPNDDKSKNMVVSAIYNTGNLNGQPCWTTSNINGNVIPSLVDVVLDAGLICLRVRNDHTLGLKVTALKFPLNRF